MRTGPLILVIGGSQAVIILDALSRPFGSIFRVGIIFPEACGAVRIHVEGRFSLRNPLRHELTNATRTSVAIEGHAGRNPHATCPSHWSKHGLAIGGVSARVAYQGDNSCLFEKWDAPDSTFEQLLKTPVIR